MNLVALGTLQRLTQGPQLVNGQMNINWLALGIMWAGPTCDVTNMLHNLDPKRNRQSPRPSFRVFFLKELNAVEGAVWFRDYEHRGLQSSKSHRNLISSSDRLVSNTSYKALPAWPAMLQLQLYIIISNF